MEIQISSEKVDADLIFVQNAWVLPSNELKSKYGNKIAYI